MFDHNSDLSGAKFAFDLLVVFALLVVFVLLFIFFSLPPYHHQRTGGKPADGILYAVSNLEIFVIYNRIKTISDYAQIGCVRLFITK